ncbi:MAG: ATP-binding cassette domain-containing protein [Alphaproteobacteria bacterium]|nr:ATP-binding cassette domain-containing protein [Alphaproteobacteria bacterium]
MIRVESISKTYATREGPLHALRDVSFHVPQGKVYGLIGLSGAGKSTALRAINLLERPESGKILLENEDLLTKNVQELRVFRQKIGMIFQHFNLLSNRTVAQNIAFPLEIAGWEKRDINERVSEVLELVRIPDKANAYPASLSGGQKQRVAIARSIANHPQVLLADEPTSALDPLIKNDILACLADLNQRLGLTIVIAAHEMKVIRRLCHEVSLFKDGQVVEELDVVDGKIAPQSDFGKLFVEEF